MSRIQVKDRAGATMEVADVGGFIVPFFMMSGPEVKEVFEHVPKQKFRDDDIMLLTFPKTGTNWMFEILSMVLNKTSEYVESRKVMTMMDARKPEQIEEVPSPRIMNVHLPYRYLPLEGLKEKQTKTILCVRNPKDTAVSYYNHVRGIKMYQYSGQWNDWFPAYVSGELEYGKYTDYLKEFETAIKDGIGFPLHVVYFEDLKTNGLEELDKLLKFLEIDLDDEMKKDIMHKCGFDQMAKKHNPMAEKMLNEGFKFLRKGTIGNWKTWFTVAQNEEFDRIWESEMKGYDMFKFRYTM
ncbi:Sulfotransferase [Mactra antiquata]